MWFLRTSGPPSGRSPPLVRGATRPTRVSGSGAFLAQVDDYVPVFYGDGVRPNAQPGIAHAPSGRHVVIEAMPGTTEDLRLLGQTVDARLLRDRSEEHTSELQ